MQKKFKLLRKYHGNYFKNSKQKIVKNNLNEVNYQKIQDTLRSLEEITSSFNPALVLSKKMQSVNESIENIRHSLGEVLQFQTEMSLNLLKSFNIVNIIQSGFSKQIENIRKNVSSFTQSRTFKYFHIIESSTDRQWYLCEKVINDLLDESEKYGIEYSTYFTDEKIVNYIEKDVDSFIQPILESKLTQIHHSIFLESIAAYKSGQYKLAIFPLFAIFDNVFSRWLLNLDDDTDQFINVFIRDLRNKLSRMMDEMMDEIPDNVHLYYLFVAYIDLFENTKSETTTLKRNAILHGAFNYDIIDKTSYLKMISLLRSMLILEELDAEELGIYIEHKKSKIN